MKRKSRCRLFCLLGAGFLLTGCASDLEHAVQPLPICYDGRKEGRTAPAKNQGSLGTCWAFASLLALKTSLLPWENVDFSEDHMSNNPNFQLTQREGGEYNMALAYLLSWQGPVAERDDPYGDGYSPTDLSAIKHVQEVWLLPPKELETIKRAVMVHGGVQSSIYTAQLQRNQELAYYNLEMNAYCCPDEIEPNHDVVIVGWDDEFPKEAFSVSVLDNGAFLCENSWGTEFGEDGFFYVSYYDSNLGKVNVAYTSVENSDNYDFIYQSDKCGWIGQVGYGDETAWAVNVFRAEQDEKLEAVGFYAIDQNTEYEVYVVHSVDDSELPQFEVGRISAASGHLDYSGYYTIKLDHVEQLRAGERFGVMVRLTTPNAVHPIAVEYDAGDGKCRIDLTDGEGYVSADGQSWERLETQYQCNLCLKAYTSER